MSPTGPQPRHLCISLSEWNRRTWISFQAIKNVKVTRRKIWDVRKMFKHFPAEYLQLIPHQIGSIGTGVIIKKGRFHPTAFLRGISSATRVHLSHVVFAIHCRHATLNSACSSTLGHQETNHNSTTYYSHLQSNEEVAAWSCAFSLCISPILHMAVSIHNNNVANFYKECIPCILAQYTFLHPFKCFN